MLINQICSLKSIWSHVILMWYKWFQDYKKFWENFGRFLKLGCIEDTGNHKRITPLLRFFSSKNEEELTSLDEYIENMGENQKAIYYLATDSLKSAKSAPFLEKLIQKDIEVNASRLIFQLVKICLGTWFWFELLSYHCFFVLNYRFYTWLNQSMKLRFRIYKPTRKRSLLISAKKIWNSVSIV